MRPVDSAVIRRLPGLRRGLSVSGAFAMASALAIVAQAACLSTVLTAAVLDDYDAPGAALPGFVAAVLVRAALTWGQQATSSATAVTVKTRLRQRLLDAVAGRRRDREHAGETVTLITRGIDGLDGYLTGYLPQMFLAATVPLTILVVLAFTDVASLIIILITLPLIPIFGMLVGWHTEAKTQRQWRTLARLGGHFLDMVAGLSTLRIFRRAGQGAREVEEIAQRHRRATMDTLRVAFLSAMVLELVATISVALIAVPIGLRLVDGTIHLATAFFILLLAPEVYLPLRSVGTQFHTAQEGLTAAKESFALLDAHTEDHVSTDPGKEATPMHRDDIQFSAVSVGYEADSPVVRDINLRVPAGSTVALVGPSGAGKTTLLNTLLGFQAPLGGRIRYGAVDLTAIDRERWLWQLAWLPQRPHLFAMSVADNIRLGLPRATDDQVRAAADAAFATEFITQLPGGFDSALGEEGYGLSAGQRRRVALARAFLRVRLLDCALVLLDEPTASLDVHSEEMVAAATAELLAGRTGVVVAHRPALLSQADEIWRVESGRLTIAEVAGA